MSRTSDLARLFHVGNSSSSRAALLRTVVLVMVRTRRTAAAAAGEEAADAQNQNENAEWPHFGVQILRLSLPEQQRRVPPQVPH